MEWSIIIGLLVTGVLLLFVEVLFIPGTTFFGITGFVLSAIGIYMAYQKGITEGTLSLVIVSVVFVGLLVIGLRSGLWMRYSLKQTITGRVNESREEWVKVGDEGETISDLRPMGRAEINGHQLDVRTLGHYCVAGTRVSVVRVDRNKIYVEPKS